MVSLELVRPPGRHETSRAKLNVTHKLDPSKEYMQYLIRLPSGLQFRSTEFVRCGWTEETRLSLETPIGRVGPKPDGLCGR